MNVMEEKYPPIVPLTVAREITGLNHIELKYLSEEGILNVYKTRGGQCRYYRDELYKLIKKGNNNG
tara:strand:+ start:53 stop:250 length:198 start_codon:yes stop_codon:yes gene_type:complete